MCGIVGVVSKNLSKNDKDRFTDLLEVDVVRGRHSTGVFTRKKRGTLLHKNAVPAGAFTMEEEYKQVLNKAVGFIVGHNRFATKGKVTKANAHPFKCNHITMVHNGTLTDTKELSGNDKLEVDSEMIAHELARRDAKDVLESLEGAYALVWYDARLRRLCMARNSERPLYLHTQYNDVWFASESAMMQWIFGRRSNTRVNTTALPVGKILYFKDNGEREEVSFTPKIKTHYQSFGFTNAYQACSGYVPEGPDRRGEVVRFKVDEVITSTSVEGYRRLIGTSDDGCRVNSYDIPEWVSIGMRCSGTVAWGDYPYGEKSPQLSVKELQHVSLPATRAVQGEEVKILLTRVYNEEFAGKVTEGTDKGMTATGDVPKDQDFIEGDVILAKGIHYNFREGKGRVLHVKDAELYDPVELIEGVGNAKAKKTQESWKNTLRKAVHMRLVN